MVGSEVLRVSSKYSESGGVHIFKIWGSCAGN